MREMYNSTFVYLKNFVLLYFGFRFRIPDSGFRIPDSGFRIPDSGFRIPDSGFRFRIPVSGFRLLGLPICSVNKRSYGHTAPSYSVTRISKTTRSPSHISGKCVRFEKFLEIGNLIDYFRSP